MDDLSALEQLRVNRYMAQHLNRELHETAQEVHETVELSRAVMAQQERIIKRLAFRLGVVSALLIASLVLLILLTLFH